MRTSSIALAGLFVFSLTACSPNGPASRKSGANPVIEGRTVQDWTRDLDRVNTAINAVLVLRKTPPEAFPTLLDGFEFAPAFSMHDPGMKSGIRLQKVAAHFGPAMVQPARDGLKSPNPKVRAGCMRTLGEIGATSAAAVPDIAPFLKSAVADERRAAAEALGQIGDASNSHADALTGLAARDPDQLVRHAATYSLGSVGPLPVASVDFLAAHVFDHGALDCARSTIERAGPNLVNAAPKYVQIALRGEVSPATAYILAALGNSVLPELFKALSSSPDPAVRAQAGRAVGEMVKMDFGRSNLTVIPDLVRAMDDPDVRVAEAAQEALFSNNMFPASALPALRRRFLTREGPHHYSALGRMGPEGTRVIAEALASEDPHVRLLGVYAAQNAQGDTSCLVPGLVRACRDENAEVRYEAVLAWGVVAGSARAKAEETLSGLLNDESEQVRTAASKYLKGIQESR